MNLLRSMESALDRTDQLHGPLYYLFVAFMIFLGAHWVGVDQIDVSFGSLTKNVGLFSSVNWLITFVILFPFFVFIACYAASNNVTLWSDLAEKRLVTGPDGAEASSQALADAWSAKLKRSNLVVLAFLFISILIAFTDYKDTAGGPLWNCSLGIGPQASMNPNSLFHAPVDWATAPIVNGLCEDHKLIYTIVSFALYYLLVVSLAFYLIFLYYITCIFVYVYRLSKRVPGGTRLVYRPETMRSALGPLVEATMVSILLGLAVCALMRSHSAYLRSDDATLVGFMTHDVDRIAKLLKLDLVLGSQSASPPQPDTRAQVFLNYQEITAPKGVTVIPLFATILFNAMVSAFVLFDAVRNALVYTREKASDAAWRAKVNLTESETLAASKQSNFGALTALVTPYGPGYVLGGLFMLLSIVTSSFLVFLVSAVVVFGYRILFRIVFKTEK